MIERREIPENYSWISTQGGKPRVLTDRSYIAYPHYPELDNLGLIKPIEMMGDDVDSSVVHRTNEPERDHNAVREHFAASLRKYLDDESERPITLRGHQLGILENVIEFFDNPDNIDGSIQAPTGSGKTVIFSSICDAILQGAPTPELRPRILTVTPTINLVEQTIAKGFGKITPHIGVASYYTRSRLKHFTDPGLLDNDVTVTTYRSLSLLDGRSERAREIYRARLGLALFDDEIEEGASRNTNWIEYSPPTGRKLVELYDVLLLDESHNASPQIERIVEEAMGNGVTVLRFSATEKERQKQRGTLHTNSTVRIADLDLMDAMHDDIITPFTAITVRPDWITNVEYYDQLSKNGEYVSADRVRVLLDSRRNELIAKITKLLVDNDMFPIIAAQPGEDQLHPHLLKQAIEALPTTSTGDGETGVERYLAAHAITSSMQELVDGELVSSWLSHEDKIKDFEETEVDALIGINILNEGFDSERVRALVAARDTRSITLAKQRLGRALRLRSDGIPKLAIAIELVSDSVFKPITTADVIYEENDRKPIELGEIVGMNEDHPHYPVLKSQLDKLIAEMEKELLLQQQTIPAYSKMTEHLATLPIVESLESLGKTGMISKRYHVMNNIDGEPEYQKVLVLDGRDIFADRNYFGVSSVHIPIINRQQPIQLDMLEVRTGEHAKSSMIIVPEYPLQRALELLPAFDPKKLYRFEGEEDQAWISAKGIEKMLGEQISGITTVDIEMAMISFADSTLEDGSSPELRIALDKEKIEETTYTQHASCLLIKDTDIKPFVRHMASIHRITRAQ